GAVRASGVPSRFEALTSLAVRLAREARDAIEPAAYVAGSIAPVEECYLPELVPENAVLQDEHAALATALSHAGVDLIIIETMNCVREARIASAAAARTGLPFMTSVALRRKDGRLYSGEDIREAAEAVLPLDPLAVLVNCTHQDVIGPAIACLTRAFART